MATVAEQLVEVQTAISEVLRYGISYHIDTQGKTRADLPELRKMESDLLTRISMSSGSMGIRAQRLMAGGAR